ncbi:hypothetical protein DPV78_006082 [Talaromyces pinophilus]|nr:hypothetical protein DPV78_006082 [Talaromyces pinophilus]
MDSAASSPRLTIPLSQRRSSLLELSKMLRELAEMQAKPEMEDVESVPEELIMNSTAHQWSDGRMWMEVLERGSATNWRCSVLNMLEYMGASKWYDSQIEYAKRTVYTTENKPVAPLTARNGTKKIRVAALVEDEFSDLGYIYIEVPTPQQRDGWSCGTRVVWNFRRLANGIEIGSWDTVLSSEDMNMDIVSGLAACVESNVVRKYSRNHKPEMNMLVT